MGKPDPDPSNTPIEELTAPLDENEQRKVYEDLKKESEGNGEDPGKI